MKRLEYIQSTREQRIDTGLKLDNTCEIEMRIAQLQSTGFLYWLRLIGSNGQMEIICQQGTDNSISVNWGGNSWSNLKTVEYEVPYTLKLNADGFFVDGEQVYVNTNKPTFSTNNITIFSYPTDGGFEMNRMRLYELTIRRGGVEIAHFLPYLDDNGVPCIYDTINEVFKYDTIGTTPFEYLDYGYKWDKITDNYDRNKRIYAVKWKNSGSFEGFFSESPNVNADDATWWNYYGLDNAEMGYCTENRFDSTRKQYSNRFYGFIDEKWENQTHTIKVSDGYIFTFPKEMYWAGKITNYDYAAAANCFEVLVADVLLDVNPNEINFTYEGGTQDITINSSSDYTYNTDGSFSVVEVEGGLSVTAEYNKSNNDIVGSITITNEDGLSEVVNITQSHIQEPYIQHNYKRGTIEINRQYYNGRTIKKAYYNGNMIFRSVSKSPKLIVDVDTLKFDNVGGTEKITITTDANLTFSSDVDWITFEQISDGVNVIASASDVNERTATITITADNGEIQTTKTVSVEQSDAIFPFPFLCNYNAKDYANRTIPKTEGQLFDEDLVFNGDLTRKGDYVTLDNSHYVDFGFPSSADNPFNRYNENGKRELTIIYKTNRFTGSSQNIFANRGGNYNYMARGNFFHTNDSSFLQFNSSVQPNITYVRVAADGKAERKSISDNISATGTCKYGGASYGVAFFRAGYQFASEYFNADFYWLFITDKYLTDSEIQRVIDYNENKITPESTNEIWYKSGNGQVSRIGTLYDENGQSMLYTSKSII